MRFLTYNLWHGLDGSGKLFFGELEPRGRKVLRAKAQIRCLREIYPDVLFVQELNPLYPGVFYYSSELQLDHIEQADLSGIKILGFGPPFNLHSGLAILAKPELTLQSLGGLQLSGTAPSNCGLFSLQLQEARYALRGEIQHSEWGKILLVNLHLHHGLEDDEDWIKFLEQLQIERGFSNSLKMQIVEELRKGNVRRESEVQKLLDFLIKEIESEKYDLIVLGGDFNSSPESRVAKKVMGLGFCDAWREARAKGEGCTWDPVRNRENHEYNKGFKSLFRFEKLSLHREIEFRVMDKVKKAELYPRRIDYFYFLTPHKYELSSSLFLGETKIEGRENKLMGSDHFGVILDLNRK